MKKILFGFGILSTLVLAGCSENIDDPIEGERECTVRQESTELVEYDINVCMTGVESVDEEIGMLIDFLTTEVELAGEEMATLEMPGKGGLYITQENFSSVEDVKSTLLNISLHTGGAHPNTFFHTWTYRINSGEIFNFNSLFQVEHNPLWTIYPKVKESLMSQRGYLVDEKMIDEGTGEADFGNYKNFVLDGKNLVILFEPYQVAPYVAGPQAVKIPFEDLQVIFQPPFLEMSEKGKATDYGSECAREGGKWISEYRECEMVSQAWCEEHMGVFKECESACRHNPKAEICTMQCVLVCEF